MEQSPNRADERHTPDSGRVAVPEIAELLHLQRPAAAVTAAVVVLVGLVVALVVPSLLPPTALVGFGVGVVALLAGAVVAVVLDGRDPVVRGPRHLRRDGHSVLARMAGPDPIEHGASVLRALERRLDEREHLSLALTGTGTDPSALAEAIGRGAAADGHTSLVIDLRAAGAPGVSDVGAGTVRLGEAATLAQDRPYAWIGAGADRAAAVSAAAGVARRPPRDLELLLVVAPEAATHAPDLLRACDRTVLLVAADTHQRAMVAARLDALARAGGAPEAVVIGGLQVGSVEESPISTSGDRRGRETSGAAGAAAASAGAAAAARATTPAPSISDEISDESDVPAVAPRPEATGDAAPSAVAPDAAPTPPAPPVREEATAGGDAGDGVTAADAEDSHDALDALEQFARDARPQEATEPDAPAEADVGDAGSDDAAEDRPLDETGPIRPLEFRTVGADGTADTEDSADAEDAVTVVDAEDAEDSEDVADTEDVETVVDTDADEAAELEGFAPADPLLRTAALEQLQHRDDDT